MCLRRPFRPWVSRPLHARWQLNQLLGTHPRRAHTHAHIYIHLTHALPTLLAASQEDSDELAYEPLEGPAAASLAQPHVSTARAGADSSAAAWRQEAHLLPALRLLADQLTWHCLSADSVWREGCLMADLAACLRALWQHSAFGELAEGVGEPLLRLAVARLGACPAEVGGFPSLLEALGARRVFVPVARCGCCASCCTTAVLQLYHNSTTTAVLVWPAISAAEIVPYNNAAFACTGVVPGASPPPSRGCAYIQCCYHFFCLHMQV